MLRTIFLLGLFAMLGIVALRLVFGILGAVVGLIIWLLIMALWISAVGFVLYVVIRVLSPETARKLRSRLSGRPY
jgi:membrane protein implicated in regulation of membrane protease activity